MTGSAGQESPPTHETHLKFSPTPPITMSKPTTSDMAHGQGRNKRLQEEDSMSSPIVSPPGPMTPRPVLPLDGSPPPSLAPRAAAAALPASPPVSLDTIPSSPPHEVLEQMASAAQVHGALSSQGRELRFTRDQQSGRTRVEVRDRQGNVLKTLSAAQALEVAAGAPLE